MNKFAPFCLVVLATSLARADQFEQIDGKAIREAIKGADAKPLERLTMSEIGSMPNLLKESRGTLLLVKTTKGNLVRLLVMPELRKPEGEGEAYPVFLLERFDTFDIEDLAARMVKGREIALFPGFGVDFDTGQIVPEGKGEDLALTSGKELTLLPKGEAKLFALTKLPPADPSKPPQPTPGRAVVARDFAGRYRLFANGQWSGTLDLAIDKKGEASGQFRSDARQVVYPVSGAVAADAPNKLNLVVKFPRSRGEFEGYLWTEGKGAIAGTFRLNDRTFGFFAVREGARFAAEGVEVAAVANPPEALVVAVTKDQITFDAKPLSVDQLADAIKAKAEAAYAVAIKATPDTAYDRLQRVIAAVQAGGAVDIRLSVQP